MRRRSKAAGCFLMVGMVAGAQEANGPEWPHERILVSGGGGNASKVKTDAVLRCPAAVRTD